MAGELIMLVGIPGSGKTTYAANLKKENPDYIIHSSDELRKELYGDIGNQEHNAELFEELHRRIRKDIKEEKTVVYDATNLVKKRRVSFLSTINCKKKCVLFLTDYDTCLKNNQEREMVVPDKVIEHMRKIFCPPHWHEGFDEIITVRNEKKQYAPLIKATKGFDQENSHHTLTLDVHLMKAAEQFSDEEYCLKTAAYLHDIGKLFTKTKVNLNGEDDGEAHYYSHHNVSAYEFLCIDENLDDLEASLYIANLIYYHMYPYLSWKQSKKSKEKDKRLIGEKMYKDIIRLHEADKKAR